ncbi:MAG: class III signal peptide-containing protein, partial [Candidatus Micrarchaeota archaeon]
MTSKAQVSAEMILLLGAMLVLVLIILLFMGGFITPDAKITYSVSYWKGNAAPLKINEFGMLYSASPSDDAVEMNLSM